MVGMKFCIISVLLILISHSFSQPIKISGIVLDAKKQLPVEGANIFVSRVEIGTTSDDDGYFKLLIDAKYNNLDKITELKSPLLLIHGKKDSISPPHMAKNLYAQASGEKQLLWIPNADHNNGFIVGGEPYRQALEQFIFLRTNFSISGD